MAEFGAFALIISLSWLELCSVGRHAALAMKLAELMNGGYLDADEMKAGVKAISFARAIILKGLALCAEQG